MSARGSSSSIASTGAAIPRSRSRASAFWRSLADTAVKAKGSMPLFSASATRQPITPSPAIATRMVCSPLARLAMSAAVVGFCRRRLEQRLVVPGNLSSRGKPDLILEPGQMLDGAAQMADAERLTDDECVDRYPIGQRLTV